MGELLEDLLKSIYGTAAAALSLLAAQLSDRGDGWGPTTHRTAAEVLQVCGNYFDVHLTWAC